MSCLSLLKAHFQPKDQTHNEPKEHLKVGSNNHSNNGWRPQASFFEGRAEGWHWYESLSDSKVEDNEKKEGKKEKRYEKKLSPSSPTQVIEAQRKALEQKLHAAILKPRRENIISYIIAQKAIMDQSQRFAESWKQVVMTTPSLDETLIHPVDQNARHIYYNEKSKDLSKRIQALANEYGLFFFFKEKCAYCHGLAPIIKRFSQKHGWSVLAISMDGGKLAEFPDAKRDNGISKHLRIAHVPALIALHPKTGQLIPLAYGLVSESEIEDRITLLTPTPERAIK